MLSSSWLYSQFPETSGRASPAPDLFLHLEEGPTSVQSIVYKKTNQGLLVSLHRGSGSLWGRKSSRSTVLSDTSSIKKNRVQSAVRLDFGGWLTEALAGEANLNVRASLWFQTFVMAVCSYP